MKYYNQIHKKVINEFFIKHNILKENNELVDTLLDKITKSGKQSLTPDENIYLKQKSTNTIDKDLENWLLSNDDSTFDNNGNKLLYDEFEDDEDLLYNRDKLMRVISKHLKKEPFSNNADWGGAYVWNVKTNDKFVGTFIYLGDDELNVLKRELIGDEYDDNVLMDINNPKELYRALRKVKSL